MYATVEPEPIDTSYLEVLSDTDLVRMVKTGSDAALGVLLRRHREALYRFCLHLTQNRDDAEDVCQESLARAITRVDSLQAGSAFRSWLFSIARNLSIDSHRSRKRICPMPDEEITPLPLPLHADSPYERIEISEEYQTVAQALSKLKKNHQTVLMLREVEGMSYAEIAQRLDISQSAVETLLFRARKRLREEYGKTGAPLPVFAFLAHLRGLLTRLASPFTGAPLVAKVVATAVMIGGAVLATPHTLPILHAASGVFHQSAVPAASVLPPSAPAANQQAVAHRGAASTTTKTVRPTQVTGTIKAANSAGGHQTQLPVAHRPVAGLAPVVPATGGKTHRHRHAGHAALTGGAPSSNVAPTAAAPQSGTQHSSATHHHGSTRSASGTSTVKGRHHGSKLPGHSSGAAVVPAAPAPVIASSRSTTSPAGTSSTRPHTPSGSRHQPASGSTTSSSSGSTRTHSSAAAGQQPAAQVQPTATHVAAGANAATGTAQTTASNATTAAQNQVKGTAAQVQATVTATTGQAQATANNAANQAQKAASSAANQAQQAVATTTTQAQQAAGSTTKQAQNAGAQTGSSASQAQHQASNTANQTQHQASNTANQAQHQATSTASQAQHQAANTANQSQHQASNTVNQVKTVTPPVPKPTPPPAPKTNSAVPTVPPNPIHLTHP
jgi:RNA polymerase sigma-70 factor (ECF subfamily)